MIDVLILYFSLCSHCTRLFPSKDLLGLLRILLSEFVSLFVGEDELSACQLQIAFLDLHRQPLHLSVLLLYSYLDDLDFLGAIVELSLIAVDYLCQLVIHIHHVLLRLRHRHVQLLNHINKFLRPPY